MGGWLKGLMAGSLNGTMVRFQCDRVQGGDIGG